MLTESATATCHLLIVSASRLLAEAIGSALTDEAEITSFSVIRWGDVQNHLRQTQCEPQLVIVDACCVTDATEIFAATQRMTQELPEAHVVVLGCEADPRTVSGCIESGASGFILKTEPLEDLLATIRAVKVGLARCCGDVTEAVLARIRELSGAKVDSARNTDAQLSEREIEVLQLVEEGLLNKEIARRLGIALSTVKNHLHSTFEKLHVETRRQAVSQAIALGLLQCQADHAIA